MGHQCHILAVGAFDVVDEGVDAVGERDAPGIVIDTQPWACRRGDPVAGPS
jgi:hypothetical protein